MPMRSHGLDRLCAVIAGVGYMFSGKWMLHLLAAGQYVAVGLAWLPLVLLLVERSIKRSSVLAATWAGVALSLVILGSHPQFTFYAGLFIGLWTLPLALEQAGQLRPGEAAWCKAASGLMRCLAMVGWSCLVAVALAAVQLLPTIEAAGQTTRGAVGMGANFVTEIRSNLLGLVGPAPESMPFVAWENRTGLTVFAMATLLLAPTLVRGQARLRLQVLVVLGLFLFAIGGSSAFSSLPAFRLFRHPSRMFLITSLPVALLMGMTTRALFDLLNTELTQRRIFGFGLFVILLVGLGSATLLYWDAWPPVGVSFLIYWASLLATFPIACWLVWSNSSGQARINVVDGSEIRPCLGHARYG